MRCPVRARKQVVTFRNCPTVIGAGRHGRCQPRRHHPPGPGYRWRVARHRLFGDEPGLVLRHGFISLRAQRHPDFRRLLQAAGAHAGQTQRRSRCSPRRHHVTLRAWTAVEPCCPGYCPPTSPPMMAPEESRPGSTAHPMDPRHASTPTQTSRTTRLLARARLLWDNIESILTLRQLAGRPPQLTFGLTVTPHGQRLRLGCPDALAWPARQMP